MKRIYPIRLTRNIWNIPLYTLEKDENNRYKINKAEIHIFSYDYMNPRGLMGELCNYDKIVIPDKMIDIVISFPLSKYVNMRVVSDTDNFSLKSILEYIKLCYIQIYNKEWSTSSVRTFILNGRCVFCEPELIKRDLEGSEIDNELFNCSICCEGGGGVDKTLSYKLRCNHIFHKDCINTWIDGDNNTCPNCRAVIKHCHICENTGVMQYIYRGVVVPYELRDISQPYRNNTDGKYGIYLYDLEELFLNCMTYDRIEKKLYLKVTI